MERQTGGCPLRASPVPWSRNVVIRSEFPYFAESAGVFVLSYLPLGVSGDSGTRGVGRMGKDEWARLRRRLLAGARPRKPVWRKSPADRRELAAGRVDTRLISTIGA